MGLNRVIEFHVFDVVYMYNISWVLFSVIADINDACMVC